MNTDDCTEGSRHIANNLYYMGFGEDILSWIYQTLNTLLEDKSTSSYMEKKPPEKER